MNILRIGIFKILIGISTCVVPSLGKIETVGIDGAIKFERLQNYFGQTIIYYDQEVGSELCTSYTVTNLMCCRRILNVTQFPLNVVSVGLLQNGDISCQVCYQIVSGFQLAPKVGMFTLYSWNYNNFSPASNGIFYAMFGNFMRRWAKNAPKFCNGNVGWNVAYAITTGQQNILLQYMKEKDLDFVHLNANCSTLVWNDENNTAITNLTSSTSSYVKLNNDGEFKCITNETAAYVVCMRNVFSIPWNKI